MDANWYGEDLGPGYIVLDGDPAPPQRDTMQPPIFGHVSCSQKTGWIKIPLVTEVGFGLGHIVSDRDPSPPTHKKGGMSAALYFLAHVYCGQTANWIKMPLGMEVGLGPCDTVLDGDPALPKKAQKEHSNPHFSAHVYCCQMAGWIKMPVRR